MFFFSGIVFPLDSLPEFVRWMAAVFPLMHSVRVVRAFYFNSFDPGLFFNLAYMILFTVLFGSMAIKRLTRRIVN